MPHARQHMLNVEDSHGYALCDTDPLKLHYDYCRPRAGVVAWSLFDAGIEACRLAIAERRLGIADLTLCESPGHRRPRLTANGATQLAHDAASTSTERSDRRCTTGTARWKHSIPAASDGASRPAAPHADPRDRYNVELLGTSEDEATTAAVPACPRSTLR